MLSDLDQEFWQTMSEMGNNVAGRINTLNPKGAVYEATSMLHGRIVQSCNSLKILLDNAPHNPSCDVAMILRGMYDAMLQCLYILVEPGLQEERARLYLDFEWVERVDFIQVIDQNSSYVASRVKNSPRREENEAAIRQKYEQVKQKYLTKKGKKGKLRKCWYEGTLRDLARAVGYEDEYELSMRDWNTFVHSSVFALTNAGASLDKTTTLTNGWLLSLRTLRRMAEVFGIKLSEEITAVFDMASKSIFDWPLDTTDG